MVSIAAAAAAEWTDETPHWEAPHWGVTDYPFDEKSSMPALEAGPGVGSVLLLVAVVIYGAAVIGILWIYTGG